MNSSYKINGAFFSKLLGKIKSSIPHIIGFIIGGIAGFVYYRMVGCSSGTCPITSSPWLSTLWGAVMGFLFVNIFTPSRK